MQCVILAGGHGTRLSGETVRIPKPMVEVGGRPMLWHIMNIYSAHGVNDFIVCLGCGRVPACAAAYAAIHAVNAFSLARALAYGFHPLVARAVLAVVMACLSVVLLSVVPTGEIPFVRRRADRAGKG